MPKRLPPWLIRWGFHLLYNQFAWTYDAVAWLVGLGQWQEWGRVAIPFLQGLRVLDLAHGPGNLLPDLAAAGFVPVGYDLSPFMGRIAQRKLLCRGLQIPLARGMAQSLPFPGRSFDSIVSTFPAEFVLHPDSLAEISRVLVPEGIFVVVPIAILVGSGLIAKPIEWLYAITGLRGAEALVPPPQLQAAGFQAEIQWVSLPHSRVMVIVNRLVQE